MRDAFAAELESMISHDPSIVLVTGDLGFGVFDDLRTAHPANFINVGIAEQNMTGIACGLASEGHKVFTYSIANFATFRCLEQIRNDACYHEHNVNVVSVGAGFSYGPLGMTHHATEDLAVMRSLPGVTVFSPGTIMEARLATREIVKVPGVGYLRIDKSHYDEDEASSSGLARFELGKARRIREGEDVALFVTGGILEEAMLAAEDLFEMGIDCRVASFHTIKPLDGEEIDSAVVETRGIVTVEEHSIIGGLGSAVAEYCLQNSCIPKSFSRVGLDDTFSSIVGSQKYLRRSYGMDKERIMRETKRILNFASE